ncbi:MauE/DoxX family redox-associated membrane protein [Streptomyces sp. NPDC048680]|uniref:MauE/DoxX family redox-associated membrane protein n=1 Tax=Streptomyces sp. NPDC048680 TaxID=3155492 RepID=UPI003440DFC5
MNDHLHLAFCCIASIVFATSALGKARAPQEFAAAVRQMRIAPERLTGPIVTAVPLGEAALALAVWVPAVAAWAFAAAVGLTAVFTAVLVSVIRRGIDTACSCFGVSSAPVGPAHVIRNAALLLVVAAGFASALISDSGEAFWPPFPDALFSLFAAAFASILIMATDVLSEIFSGTNKASSRTQS